MGYPNRWYGWVAENAHPCIQSIAETAMAGRYVILAAGLAGFLAGQSCSSKDWFHVGVGFRAAVRSGEKAGELRFGIEFERPAEPHGRRYPETAYETVTSSGLESRLADEKIGAIQNLKVKYSNRD